MAWEQFALPYPALPKPLLRFDAMPALTTRRAGNRIVVEGDGFAAVFGVAEGRLLSYQAGGRELLAAGPEECTYRAPTDHDLLMGNPPANVHVWRAAGYDRMLRFVTAVREARLAPALTRIIVEARLQAPGVPDGIDSTLAYTVYGNGEILVEHTAVIPPNLTHIPRVGVELALPAGAEQLAWYGRGPHENYCDRVHGAAVGQSIAAR